MRTILLAFLLTLTFCSTAAGQTYTGTTVEQLDTVMAIVNAHPNGNPPRGYWDLIRAPLQRFRGQPAPILIQIDSIPYPVPYPVIEYVVVVKTDTLYLPIPPVDDPDTVVVVEPDQNPAEGPEPIPFDTTAPKLFVVEDVSAEGNVVSLRFRDGWDTHDSIQATNATRSGLDFTAINCGLVSVKVFRTILDQLGRTKLAQPSYSYWVPCGAPVEVVIPDSIDATGLDDVCPADGSGLQRWLASLPNGSVIRGNGRYRCDYGVTLDNRWNLTFTGGVTLFTDYDAEQSTDSNRKAFRLLEFNGGGNISIDGWTFRGSRPDTAENYVVAKETQHGLEFNGTNGITLRNVTVEHVWGDWVNLSFANSKWGEGLFVSEPSRHVEISNGTFVNAGRQGIAMTGLYDAQIYENEFNGVQRSLWDFEPGGRWEWIQDVDIYQNQILGRVRNNVAAGHGSGLWVQNITLRDNDFGPIKGFRMSWGGNRFRTGLHILRNVAHVELGSSSHPIEVSGINDVNVIGNTILLEARRQKAAVLIQNQRPIGTPSFKVEGNVITGARVAWRWEANKNDPLAQIIEGN